MVNWISVKDCLPEQEGLYLVARSTKINGKTVGCRHFYENYPGAFLLAPSITHWMPMPDPPEEGGLPSKKEVSSP